MKKYVRLLIVAIALAWSLACGLGKADTVFIVEKDTVKVRGKSASFVVFQGEYTADIWLPGSVVLFRVDGAAGTAMGKAGTVYQIGEDYDLHETGKFDVTSTDEQLVQQYVGTSDFSFAATPRGIVKAQLLAKSKANK
jgi:hypothetical protein